MPTPQWAKKLSPILIITFEPRTKTWKKAEEADRPMGRETHNSEGGY
jgi:hypothetical protein